MTSGKTAGQVAVFLPSGRLRRRRLSARIISDKANPQSLITGNWISLVLYDTTICNRSQV